MSRQILEILAGLGEDEQLKIAAEKHAHQPEMGEQSGAGLEGEIKAQMGGTAMDARAVLHEKALQSAGDQLDARTWDDPRENLTQQATAPMGNQGVAPSDTGRNVRETKTSLPSKTAMKMRTVTNIARKGRAGRVIATSAGKAVRSAKGAGKQVAGRVRNFAVTTGDDVLRKARSKATQAGMLAREHKGALQAAGAGAVGAAGGAAAGYAGGRKKAASLSDYVELLSREDGEKVASEHFSEADLADLNIQATTGIFMGRAIALGQIKEAAGL